MSDEWDKLYEAAVTYGTGPIVASNPDIIYLANAGKEILRIDPTGKVFINPDYTIDEAAKAFWEMVDRIHPLRAPEVQRLRVALRQYGDHTYECDLKNGHTCTCGYEVALSN